MRESALKCLRAVRKTWTAAVEPTLRELLEREPDEDVAKRIRRVLGLSQGRKQQRYVDVSDLDLGAVKNAQDFYVVMDTVIAGAWFRDLSVAEGLVEAGDVLLLMREPDNAYDQKAIMVLAEDGYMLGYIPRADNPALAERMDRGEFFCAILNEHLHANRPSISVIRPHRQDMRRKLPENVVPFPKYPGMEG